MQSDSPQIWSAEYRTLLYPQILMASVRVWKDAFVSGNLVRVIIKSAAGICAPACADVTHQESGWLRGRAGKKQPN